MFYNGLLFKTVSYNHVSCEDADWSVYNHGYIPVIVIGRNENHVTVMFFIQMTWF